MASKHTTRPLQRISLVRSNREGWIGDDGAHLQGYKHVAQTKPEEQGPLKLATLAPQVSYSKPKRSNYYAKSIPF